MIILISWDADFRIHRNCDVDFEYLEKVSSLVLINSKYVNFNVYFCNNAGIKYAP